MICPKCNYEVPDGSRFCNCCGYKFEQENTIKCPNPECGHLIPADSKFCPDCGTKIEWVKPKYKYIGQFSQGIAPAWCEDGFFRYIDKEGAVIIKGDNWTQCDPFVGDYAVIVRNHKVGIIDRMGRYLLVPKNYDYCLESKISEFIVACRLSEDSICFYDIKKSRMIPGKFQEVLPFSEGLAAVRVNDNWGYINKQGNFVIEPNFDMVAPFAEGKAIVTPKWGKGTSRIIDKQGCILKVLDERYFLFQNQNRFSSGWAIISLSGESVSTNFINESGEKLLKFDEFDAEPFTDGYAVVKPGGMIIIDTSGNTVLSDNFYEIKASGDLALVRVGDKWGVIKISTGEYIVPCKYDCRYPRPPKEGIVTLYEDEHAILFDEYGNRLL